MAASDFGYKDELKNLQQKLDHQLLIHDFVKDLLKQNSVDDILWTICKNVISKLGLEDCVIYLLDEKHGTFIQKAAYGPKNPVAQEIVSPIIVPIGEGVVGTVGKTGIAEIINDTTLDKRYIVDDAYRLSELAVPIINDMKVIGVIDSEHSTKNFYTEYHLQMLETISSLCASQIANALLHEEINLYKNELECIVDQRTEELNESIKKLEASNDHLERYAYVVSHDLKSPLNTIAAFVGLIESAEPNLGEKSKGFIEIIQTTTARMNSLLKDVLQASLKTNTSLELALDLNDVLHAVIQNLEYEINSRQVEIVLKDKLPRIKALEAHFVQMFQNILSNSIKYSHPDQIPKIEITVDTDNFNHRILFRDYGIGIESEFEDSIFNLGERNIDDHNGSGVGLHTCKRIAEHYKGSIKAHSHGIGKGLTICIELPNT